MVTAIELSLYPGESLFGGSLAFPARSAVDVLTAAFELARDIPELGLDIGMARFPDLPMLPPPLRGQTLATVAMVHLGDEDTARSYADRLIAVAEPVANTLHAVHHRFARRRGGRARRPMPSADFGGSIDRLDETFAREFVDAFLAGADLGLMRCSVRALGGAIADELGAESSAIGAVQAGGFLNSGVVLFDPTLDPGPALQPLRDLVERHPGDRTVPTFLGLGATLADAYPSESSTGSRRSSSESIPRGSSAATGR